MEDDLGDAEVSLQGFDVPLVVGPLRGEVAGDDAELKVAGRNQLVELGFAQGGGLGGAPCIGGGGHGDGNALHGDGDDDADEDEGGEDLTPENVQSRLAAFETAAGPSEGFKRNIGYLESMAVQFKDHPNPVGAIHNLLSGGKANVKNPNEPTFQAILQNQKQVDPYLNQKEVQKAQKLSYTQMTARAFGAGRSACCKPRTAA